VCNYQLVLGGVSSPADDICQPPGHGLHQVLQASSHLPRLYRLVMMVPSMGQQEHQSGFGHLELINDLLQKDFGLPELHRNYLHLNRKLMPFSFIVDSHLTP
jgi:hypothetical protein